MRVCLISLLFLFIGDELIELFNLEARKEIQVAGVH